MVLPILLLMVKGTFWGVFGGLRLWGDWFNNAIGLGPLLNIKANLESPLLHRMFLMNIVLVLGALAAALMSRQFSIYRASGLVHGRLCRSRDYGELQTRTMAEATQ